MNSGFIFYIPSRHVGLFWTYLSQIDETRQSGRFIKNWNMKKQKRIQPTGQNSVKKMVECMCVCDNKPPTGYSTHCFRRSAATNLADSGVSIFNLKRHGQWKSDYAVVGYIANSKPLRIEREQNLLPPSLRDTTENNMSKAAPDQPPSDEETYVDLESPPRTQLLEPYLCRLLSDRRRCYVRSCRRNQGYPNPQDASKT